MPSPLAGAALRAVLSVADADAVLGDLDEELAHRRLTRAESVLDALWLEWRVWRFVLATAASRLAAWIPRLRSECGSAAHALRNRRWRAPLTAAVVGVCLAASGTLLCISDSLTLATVPYQDPNRLVVLRNRGRLSGLTDYMRPEEAEFWRGQRDLFAEFNAYDSDGSIFLSIGGTSDEYPIVVATPGLLPMLGAKPRWGRNLLSGDASAAIRPVVIAEDLARLLYAEPGRAIGQNISDESRHLVIVGVVPSDFRFPTASARIWAAMDLGTRGISNVRTLARMAGGRSIDELNARVVARSGALPGPRVPAFFRAAVAPPGTTGIEVVSFRAAFADARTDVLFTLLLSAAGALLVIACLNVAGFEVGESSLRSRDSAIQMALGATKGRLIRVGVLQGGALIGTSVLAALALIHLTTSRLVVWMSTGLAPGLSGASGVTLRTLGAMAGLAATAWVLAFGWTFDRASGHSTGEILKRDQRLATPHRQATRLRQGLAVVQIAGSVVLLIVAMASITAYLTDLQMERGFDSRRLLGIDVDPGPVPRQRAVDLGSDIFLNLQRLPGITGVAETALLPPDSSAGPYGTLVIDGQSRGRVKLALNKVGPMYFDTLRLPLRIGRVPTPADQSDAVVVDEDFARRYWPGKNPVGERFSLGREFQVVGIAAHILLDTAVTNSGDPQFAAYQALPAASSALRFVVRVDDLSLLREVTQEIRRLAPQSQARIGPIDDRYARLHADAGIAMTVVTVFGVLAFAIAAVGVSGLVSFSAAARTRELAVRLALGAGPSDIRWMVLGYPLRLVCYGVPAGVAMAWILVRVNGAYVSRLIRLDPTGTVAVAGIVAVLVIASAVGPAVRVSRLDSSHALRE
jgi:predicted permease